MPLPRLVAADSPLYRLRRLPKLVSKKLCILLVENGYHVQRECREALTRMGHRVVTLQIGTGGGSLEPSLALDMFLQSVIAHRPDMMLTIDCLAFDRVDWMSEVVDAVGLPTAIWYVDSPLFIALGFLNPAPECASTFSWDRGYVPVLKQLGVTRVHHLPLATEPSIFNPGDAPKSARYPIAFVGNTLTVLERRWHDRLNAHEHDLARTLHQALVTDRAAICVASSQARAPIDRDVIALAYANFLASRQYRLGLLQALPQRSLHLFGDTDWRNLLPCAHSHAGFAYGERLADVFRKTTVNFNATNLQMPCTVNQRVFDVPACGGLLLTDRQAELENYFIPEKEVLVYDSAEQAHDLARFYCTKPERGRHIIAAAQKRVDAEHTYEHRLTDLIQTMRESHAHGYLQPSPQCKNSAPRAAT